MYERFSPAAKKVMQRAKEFRRALLPNYIGTEHVLLALLEDPSVIEILEKQGTKPEDIKKGVESIATPGELEPTGEEKHTPRLELALANAEKEAVARQQELVDPLDLLVGLAAEDGGIAGQAIQHEGLRIMDLRLEASEYKKRMSATGTPKTS